MPEISARSRRVWQRLTEWYGTRMVEQYGEVPPSDWCEVVDDSDNESVRRGLAHIRVRFPQHPPTLPQFEQVMRPVQVSRGPTVADRLCEHVMREHGGSLTPTQIRSPWTYLGAPEGIIGVIVPADGERPGYRVMVADLGAPDWLVGVTKYAQGEAL